MPEPLFPVDNNIFFTVTGGHRTIVPVGVLTDPVGYDRAGMTTITVGTTNATGGYVTTPATQNIYLGWLSPFKDVLLTLLHHRTMGSIVVNQEGILLVPYFSSSLGFGGSSVHRRVVLAFNSLAQQGAISIYVHTFECVGAHINTIPPFSTSNYWRVGATSNWRALAAAVPALYSYATGHLDGIVGPALAALSNPLQQRSGGVVVPGPVFADTARTSRAKVLSGLVGAVTGEELAAVEDFCRSRLLGAVSELVATNLVIARDAVGIVIGRVGTNPKKNVCLWVSVSPKRTSGRYLAYLPARDSGPVRRNNDKYIVGDRSAMQKVVSDVVAPHVTSSLYSPLRA